ncbi:MAG: arginine--tRNA ligase [Gemmatimonadaceae bacterium]|nr:arginine--tRNA ligase [Gemmatimonadaceae bacterium]
MSTAERIRAELLKAARELGAPDDTAPVVERPRDNSHGDWTSNVAMTLARPLKKKPGDIANALKDTLDLEAAGVEAVEIAGPGFMNFRLNKGIVARELVEIVAGNADFGKSDVGKGEAVNVEFVSANPTGPLHVGHGRQAALGDAVSTLLEWSGWKVTREFYYNDGGVQIENLAKSVIARIDELQGVSRELPEGFYHGEYIRELAERYIAENPGKVDFDSVRAFAVQELRKEQDLDLQAFGVKFDEYFLESSLYTDRKVVETVEKLTAAGMTYESDNALWLKTTEFGDDKDRVMRKRDGTYTYFLPDVAYHVTKWQRGFRRAIDIQGADHHSTATRVRAGLQALNEGIPVGYPEYVLHQMVTVMKGGEEVKISKRAGSYVTVRDLINEVGRDAVRYFFIMRKSDSQLEFDIDLALSQSEENPVYYVQMAHARMCGIFRVGEIDRITFQLTGIDLSVLVEKEEQDLIKALTDFPSVILGAAQALEPHRLAGYLLETARLAHLWYHKHHVLGQPENITRARLALARGAQIVLANGLGILGISAPERM